ncbi:hypothetical protein [Leptolyngbya iicbica]|uniref:Uncharacterized protein n=2 Tax=Cyanophyceae TaxID=3028117 RepID=A0A4Q7EF08_9CYAN|nr:hypothetical protein [Leptolyngbya sp. LK]RZM81792.1 hypothetical protein DYY88_00465 [Leptolyngbya sp. LK]
MNACTKAAIFTVGSTVSFSMMNAGAHAQSTGTAADLLPLDNHGVSMDTLPDQLKAVGQVSAHVKPEATYSPEMLNAVASNINHTNQPSPEDHAPNLGDIVDLGFVEQFIDEDGNVDLPLGITVYEAMGQTSIGFGLEFR